MLSREHAARYARFELFSIANKNRIIARMNRGTTFTSALLVFLAGASYGVMAPVIKTAYAAGFTWQQTTAGQSTFGVLLFLIAVGIARLRGTPWQRLDAKQTGKLVGTGIVTCCTCVLYSISLSYLPVAVSLVLLFQFTWIGIVIQVIATRRAPTACEIVAALVVIAGTLLASGLLDADGRIAYNPLGMACALGSAFTCALFMFLSSRVETQLPPMQRGLIICCGSLLLAYATAPTFALDGTLLAEAPYGFMQGLFALVFPVLLFGIGGKNLPTGIVSILASAELPTSIVLSALFLGEGVTPLQTAGIVLILVGVVIAQADSLIKRDVR